MSGRRRHFTLLELAIAVTIFMMVAVALFAFSGHVSSSWGSITTERNRLAELLAMDSTLDGILSHAYLTNGPSSVRAAISLQWDS